MGIFRKISIFYFSTIKHNNLFIAKTALNFHRPIYLISQLNLGKEQAVRYAAMMGGVT